MAGTAVITYMRESGISNINDITVDKLLSASDNPLAEWVSIRLHAGTERSVIRTSIRRALGSNPNKKQIAAALVPKEVRHPHFGIPLVREDAIIKMAGGAFDFQNVAEWTCERIEAYSKAIQAMYNGSPKTTRVSMLSSFRKHLNMIGVPRGMQVTCYAFDPEMTASRNADSAAKRVTAAENPLCVNLADGAKAIAALLAKIRADGGEDAFKREFLSRSRESARILGQLVLWLAARVHELVPTSSESHDGMLMVNPDGTFAGVLKKRIGDNTIITYDPDIYGLSVDDAHSMLTYWSNIPGLHKRQALAQLKYELDKNTPRLTPKDLRLIGADQAVKRSGAAPGLPSEEVRATALRHNVLPSSSTLSAYQRVETPKLEEKTPDLYVLLITRYASADQETRAAIDNLLSING